MLSNLPKIRHKTEMWPRTSSLKPLMESLLHLPNPWLLFLVTKTLGTARQWHLSPSVVFLLQCRAEINSKDHRKLARQDTYRTNLHTLPIKYSVCRSSLNIPSGQDCMT